MIDSALTRILRHALEDTPGALGSSLAASDGEMVGAVAEAAFDLAFVTAHSAILVAQARAALRTFHWGDPVELMLVSTDGAVVTREVADGYFALLALAPGASLSAAQRSLGRAADALRREIA